MLLKSTPARLCQRTFLLPLFFCVACFVAGIICGARVGPFKPSHHELHLQPLSSIENTTAIQIQQVSAAESPAPKSAAPVPIRPKEPLGLQWLKQGYENPWQFSTLRTGIEVLNDTLTRRLRSAGALPRIVVSFTSLPKRFIKYAYPMISLLKSQTYPPDAIYVCIPQGSRRSEGTFQVPSWMLEDPQIIVLRPEVDMGPATKLIPALEAEITLGNTHTRIVTVDDDNEGGWTKDSLLQLFAYSLHFPNAAIGFTGWNVTCMVSEARCSPEDSGVPRRQKLGTLYNFVRQSDDFACHSLGDWLPDYYSHCLGAIRKNYIGFVDVLEGYKGVLYQPRFFNMKKVKSLMDTRRIPESFFLCDDVWFSGWLGVNNVSRIVVNPAFHESAPVRQALMRYSRGRKLSTALAKRTQSEELMSMKREEVEVGLHSLGEDFVNANHNAVIWFEFRSAWTKDMWKRPEGFLYVSEQNSADRNVT